MASADVYVDVQHGENCTCHKLDPISVTPVIVHDDCPGIEQQPRRKPPEIAGRIAITWPASRVKGMAIPAWGVQIHDLDADQPILTATGLRIVIGGENWESGGIYADVTILCDHDGKPLIAGRPREVLAECYGPEGDVLTGVFRYAVAEMRVTEAKA